MNKKIIILVLIGILNISMIGCASSASNSKSIEPTNKIIDTGDAYKIGDGDVNYRISYDTKTNIVYICAPYIHNTGISLLYNKDLKPMTIDEYNNNTNKYKGRFIDTGDIYKIGDGDARYHICYDSETNVVYIASPYIHNSGISVMADVDGNPMTLSRYNETK